MSWHAGSGIMYAEDVAVKNLRTALFMLIAICLAACAYAQDYQPPALYKDTETLQTYLERNPELVRARFEDDLTLLHFAAINGDTTGAKLIIERGGKVNAVDKFGRTPLHLVRLLGITELLLSRGADVTIKDKSGATPFDVAHAWHRLAVAKALAKYTIFPAVAKSDLRTVQRIVYAFPEAVSVKDKNGSTPLHYAASTGDRTVCEMLLSAGADPRAKDGKGRTPLGIAMARGHKAAAEVLLAAMERKATPKQTGKEQSVRALFLAVMQDDSAAVKSMLKSDPGLAKASDASGMTALMVAIDAGKNEIAQFLINSGANVNASDGNGLTPLFRAVDNLDLTRLLVLKGARVTARSKNQRTPLHEAACFGTEEVAAYLISAGADVNALDADGKTPLTLALQSGTHPGMVKLLTPRGVQ